ncbi:MAG: hypothetical protein HN350_15730 [Phycisphaerales bacterium]|jgi:hypothetical protein|nr:hypothetical protein [Phycisphaerales bacterium]
MNTELEKPENKSDDRSAVGRRRWRRRIVLLLVIVGASAGLACWQGCPNAVGPVEAPETQPADAEDARQREMVLGAWTDDYKGKRTMILKADGTGTMHVELSGFNAILGSKMRFDMVWSVKDGRLKKRTIGGEPSGRVNLILKAMGDRVDEPIIELNDQRLWLQDADGETIYYWRRVSKPASDAGK